MSNNTVDYTVEKFLITDEPVMKLAMDVLLILNKFDKVTIVGKGGSCPSAVSVANIITQNISSGSAKTEKISVDSEKLDDGQLKSIIEIMITEISS